VEHFFLYDRVRVVMNNAPLRFLAREAPPAELDLLADEADFFYRMAGFPCASGKFLGQRVRVAALAGAGGDDQNFPAHVYDLPGSDRCERKFERNISDFFYYKSKVVEWQIAVFYMSICFKNHPADDGIGFDKPVNTGAQNAKNAKITMRILQTLALYRATVLS
jgi:hypothetical protein